MRFVKPLPDDTIRLLQRIYKHSQSYRVRQRAHSILLSHQGYPVTTLRDIFQVTRCTLYHWFDAWEEHGLNGLYDQKGKGRKPALSPPQKEQVKQWVKENPKRLRNCVERVQKAFGLSLSKRTLQRSLKERNFSWRRIRQTPKGKPDPTEYQLKKQELNGFKEQEDQGLLELCYYDESGFCLTSYVPYAWQEKGQTIEVATGNHSQRLNVLGFLSRKNTLHAYTTEGGVDSATVIACFDDFSRQLTKRTVVVIDRASFHTSRAFKAKIPAWREKQLEIFYLPAYSPELNLIEILWRFIKYEWVEFSAYENWNSLVQYIEKILINYGTEEYQINFG